MGGQDEREQADEGERVVTIGLLTGYFRYMVMTPLTFVGAVSLYIYGGFWLSLYTALPHLFTGEYVTAMLTYFISEALPPTSLEQIVIQLFLGTLMAGTKWLVAMGLLR